MTLDIDDLARSACALARGTALAMSCRYLYHTLGSTERRYEIDWHEHDHHQLESVATGEVIVRVTASEFVLGPGAFLLIPPGLAHRLSYRGRLTRFRSIKFRLHASTPFPSSAEQRLLGDDPLLDAVSTAMDRCLATRPLPMRPLDALITAFMERWRPASDPRAGAAAVADPLAAAVAASCLRANGRALPVAAVAQRLGLSPGRLSARLRQAVGMPLKRFIDEERMRYAAGLLATTRDDLTRIAGRMGFADLHAFSRFFRRHAGESPGRFRARLTRLRASDRDGRAGG